MRELTFVKPGTLEWRDVRAPELRAADDALVRPLAVTTCDLDLAILDGRFPLPGPFALGHEFVAEILDRGEAVDGFGSGQVVLVPFQISCGTCDRCRAGYTNACRAVPFRSAYGLGSLGGSWGGAFSDVLRVPFAPNMLIPIPHGVDPHAIACASDNLPDAWRTVGPHLVESPGAEVLIVGGVGSVPLYAVAVARAMGAAKVDYLDTDEDRLALARSLGASCIEGPPPERAGEYPITVDASADPAGLACALRSTAPFGICTSIGIYLQDTPLPLFEMFGKGIRFHTSRVNARAHVHDVLDLVQAGRIRPERVTTKVVAWDDAIEILLERPMKPLFVRDPIASGREARGRGGSPPDPGRSQESSSSIA